MINEELNSLENTNEPHEQFIDFSSNPNYSVDEEFLDKFILENKIDIEYKTSNTNKYDSFGPAKETALIRAIRAKNIPFIQYLINKGVDVNNSRESDSSTPMMIAAFYIPEREYTVFSSTIVNKYSENGLAIVKLLFDAGADINKGNLLNFWAGGTDNILFNEILDKITNVHGVSEHDKTNLLCSSLMDNLSLEQFIKIHEKGADIHWVNKNNHNPFFIAAALGKMDIVEYLFKFNIDTNIISSAYKKNIFEHLEHIEQTKNLQILKELTLKHN